MSSLDKGRKMGTWLGLHGKPEGTSTNAAKEAYCPSWAALLRQVPTTDSRCRTCSTGFSTGSKLDFPLSVGSCQEEHAPNQSDRLNQMTGAVRLHRRIRQSSRRTPNRVSACRPPPTTAKNVVEDEATNTERTRSCWIATMHAHPSGPGEQLELFLRFHAMGLSLGSLPRRWGKSS